MKKYISPLIALVLLLFGGLWMLTGNIVHGGRGDDAGQTIQAREAQRQNEIFKVRAKKIFAKPRLATLDLRGRTKSRDLIYARAKIGGIVEKSFAKKGEKIKIGDMLCQIEDTTMATRANQAKTQLAETKENYEAALKLLEDGFTTDAQLRNLKSAYHAAIANMTEAEQAMQRSIIRAEVNAIAQDPIAKVGDNLAAGGICATLLENDPMLFTAQISQRHVGEIKLGNKAEVALITGEIFTGKITFIASSADEQTRTFEVEITIPNDSEIIRAGLSATAKIELETIEAFELTPSWLVLSDSGEIGVRAIDENNKAQFMSVKIISQTRQAVWVSGLDDGNSIITLGQNYVKDGEEVEPVFQGGE